MPGLNWSRYGAVLFDMDGVVTATARVHAAAWKEIFDDFLAHTESEHEPFVVATDYRAYVDGRPRYDGVAAFLESREIALPRGTPDDPPGYDTVCAVGNLKNEAFHRLLIEHGADVYADTMRLLEHLAEIGTPTAVVTASANCDLILESVGLSNRFDARVDGHVAADLELPGKPAPDTFLEAARRLGVPPGESVVIEDAVSGVAAGKAGGFAYVIGMDRHGDPGPLVEAGADVVVSDIRELLQPSVEWNGYPFLPEPWGITREGVNPDLVGLDETLFSLGNGNLGTRAVFEQGSPVHEPGTLLNGFHETWPIVYPEPAYGFASLGQTILALPEASSLRVRWDNRLLDLTEAEVKRRLDFRTGILTTNASWPEADVRWERLVSLRHRDVLALRVTVEPKREGTLDIESSIVNWHDLERSGEDVQFFEPGEMVDPRLAPVFGRRLLQPGEHKAAGSTCALSYRTTSSEIPITVAGRVKTTTSTEGWSIPDPDQANIHLTATVSPGSAHSAEVVVTYRRDEKAATALSYLEGIGDFETLAAQLGQDWARLWATSDVSIEGDDVAQQAVRFAIFHLHQASAALQGQSVAARGLSGRTYEGHYFWDSAVFVLPFLSATNPDAARQIIKWRHSILPAARERAKELSVDGALYPWRTITGEEASAFFEAGTAQFHINADVVYGIRTYLEWTGDDQVLWDYGVEIAVETARMWASLGFTDREGFHIHGVTGPDEYTALVNDNAFTNQMARMNLRFAIDAVKRMETEQPDDFETLAARLDLHDDEIAEWSTIADDIVIIRDPLLEVTAQDSTFLSLEPWNWSTPPEKYPLLLHFHPLVLYRHRVLKQADVVMAHFLLPGDTSLEQRRKDFDYYDPITTGDSSLSAAIQAAVAAEVGRSDKAWHYFAEAAALDLEDRSGSGANGIHVASAAGVWLALARGFTGISLDREGHMSTDPRLPSGWKAMTLNLMVRGQQTQIRVEGENGS